MNSPRALSNARLQGGQAAGTTVWRWDLIASNTNGSNAFGSQLAQEDVDANGTAVTFDLRFPGQQYDSETGLNYNYFRDYEAATGRYVESDPIGLRGGVSTFGYVGGMPLMFYDPKGLYTFGEFWQCINSGFFGECFRSDNHPEQPLSQYLPPRSPVAYESPGLSLACQSFFCFNIGTTEMCNPVGPEKTEVAVSTPALGVGFKTCCRSACDANKPNSGEAGLGLGKFASVSVTRYDICLGAGVGLSPPWQGSYGVGGK